jgi:phospholipid/cholesterol/gamma-HCH transport system ATP-binding protein
MIALEQVSVSYQGWIVLGPIDLDCAAGAFIGLIGPPGSGKSVLLKVIAGLVRPVSGRLSLFGEHAGPKTEEELRRLRRRIGMVFQNNALFDSKTIGENVAFPLRRRDPADPEIAADEIDERVRSALEAVGLAGTEHLYPHELSGGMQKRAGIARATVFDPLIRLYDEPTAGLDPVTSARILRLIEVIHAKEEGVSIVISNEMSTMLSIVPRAIMLLDGRLVFDGPRGDLQTDRAPEIARRFVAGDVDAPI